MLTRDDYTNILALLGRTPLQGLAEARALHDLGAKIEATIQHFDLKKTINDDLDGAT